MSVGLHAMEQQCARCRVDGHHEMDDVEALHCEEVHEALAGQGALYGDLSGEMTFEDGDVGIETIRGLRILLACGAEHSRIVHGMTPPAALHALVFDLGRVLRHARKVDRWRLQLKRIRDTVI